MTEQIDTSVEFNDFMFIALDHGVKSIEDGASPLMPFAMTKSAGGEQTLQRFATQTLEAGVEAAKEYVERQKSDISIYAIVWDGFLTLNNKKWDAVLVEAGEQGGEFGVLLAQRYEKKGILKKRNHPVGNPALISKPASRICPGRF